MSKSARSGHRGRAVANLSRRTFGIGLTLSAIAGCNRAADRRLGPSGAQDKGPTAGSRAEPEDEGEPSVVMPVGFVGHGAPTLAFDQDKGADLLGWARTMPRPSAILVISAHWQTAGPALGSTQRRPLIYDFSGFPRRLYEVEYRSPGAPDLAAQVTSLLAGLAPVERSEGRGLDHGVWVPLLHLQPKADVPVLQLSLPRWSPKQLFDLGRRLAPLRSEGVLILGSGNLTHNLRMLGVGDSPQTPTWARDFDAWIAHTLDERKIDQLLSYRSQAPSLSMAHPTEEHFQPLLVAAGAATGMGSAWSPPTYPVTGFEYAHISRRCVRFG